MAEIKNKESLLEREDNIKINTRQKIEDFLLKVAESNLELIKYKGYALAVLGTGGAIYNMATLQSGGNTKAALAAMLLGVTGFMGSSIISEMEKKRKA